MKVKFNRSILVSGSHCEVGSEAEIPDIIAKELIASGDVSPREKPSKEIETADAPAPENAAKRTKNK